MEATESSQLCTRCSAVLPNHVIDNDISVLYCAGCAVQGCGPPVISRLRNVCDSGHDSVDVAELSGGMLSVGGSAGHAQCCSLNDSSQTVLLGSAALTDVSCQSGYLDIDSSTNSHALVLPSQLQQHSDSVSSSGRDAEQSSMRRLVKLMETLVEDEDIQVDSTADHDDVCCQFDVSEIDSEDSSVKHAARSDHAVWSLSTATVEDDGDGLMTDIQHVVQSKSHQVDGSASDVFCDTAMSDHSHKSTLNSAGGRGFLGCVFLLF